jgi:hypothetical protein
MQKSMGHTWKVMLKNSSFYFTFLKVLLNMFSSSCFYNKFSISPKLEKSSLFYSGFITKALIWFNTLKGME